MKKVAFSFFVLLALVFQVQFAVAADESFSDEFAPVDEAPSALMVPDSELGDEFAPVDGDDASATEGSEEEFGDDEFAPVEGETETPAEEPASETPRSSRGGQKRSTGGSSSQGEVLGASTDGSCQILTSYMRMGQANNVEDVKLLQSFLATNLGIDLPVTGYFGSLTDKAVRDFQLKYAEEILKPWVTIGGLPNSTTATGYVYKTTQYTINTMLCPDLAIAQPALN